MRLVSTEEGGTDGSVDLTKVRYCLVVANGGVKDTGHLGWGFAAQYGPAAFHDAPYGRIYRLKEDDWLVETYGNRMPQPWFDGASMQTRRRYTDRQMLHSPDEPWQAVFLISGDDFTALEKTLRNPPSYAALTLVVRAEGEVPTSRL